PYPWPHSHESDSAIRLATAVRFSDGKDHSPQNRRAVNKLSGDKYDVADLDPIPPQSKASVLKWPEIVSSDDRVRAASFLRGDAFVTNLHFLGSGYSTHLMRF